MKKSLAALASLAIVLSGWTVAPVNEAYASSYTDAIISGHANKEIPYDNSTFLKSSEYIDPSASEIKPTLTVDKLEVEASEAPGSVQTVNFVVSGADNKYASAGIHIYYDDRLTVVPDAKGRVLQTELEDLITLSRDIGNGELFFAAISMGDYGTDGVLIKGSFRIPEDAKAGDLYPVGIGFNESAASNDLFINRAENDAGKLMQAYLFTQGIENGYIKVVGDDEPSSEASSAQKGDANLDGDVNIADAVLVMQVATNPDKYAQGKSDVSIKPQGEINADVDGKKGLTNSDALLIQKFKLGLIDSLGIDKISKEEIEKYEKSLIDLINVERQNAGVQALEADENLMKAADVRAEEISDKFSSERPNGEACFSVLKEYSIKWTYTGENMARDYSNPEDVLNMWMSEQKSNFVSKGFKYLGVGLYVDDEDNYYWNVIFVG